MGHLRGPQVADWWQTVPVGRGHCRQGDDAGRRGEPHNVGGDEDVDTVRQEALAVDVELGFFEFLFHVITCLPKSVRRQGFAGQVFEVVHFGICAGEDFGAFVEFGFNDLHVKAPQVLAVQV